MTLFADVLVVVGFAAFLAACVGYAKLTDRMVSGR